MGISIDDGACGVWQRVPDEVISRLDGLPGAAYEVPDEVTCALETGHPDKHMAVLQGWGNQEAWLVWATPTTVTAPGCRVDGLTCLLPVGHVGRHHVIMTDVVEDEGPYWCDSRADLELQRTPI
ncbi:MULTISPECIES: hypothetical protein [unclassified Frankia]|uniref:hypothetical protein n=1 Tax=unclassified Frankia TaxID=2632575 RepID=UPI002AD3724F|nr:MULTISPECIES: hypothetical protein [unclassified Frankia]